MNTEEQQTRTRGGVIRHSAEQRRKLIAEFKRSGQNQKDFCEGRDLNATTFSGWLRKAAEGRLAFAEVSVPVKVSADIEIELPNGVRVLLHGGTRFYAYYGVPEGKAPKGGWPAVVCVHGGGQSASAGRVKSWMDHGYAAISMDLEGRLPTRHPRPGHDWSGPGREGNFDSEKISKGVPPAEHWFYHAIAGIVRANSLLGSFAEINRDRIGIEGTSWGGVLTSLAMGIDPRIKFGITNTGCGFLQEGDSYLGVNFNRMAPDKRKVAIGLYEPSTYIANAELPTLWVNSTTDVHFPLDCTQKTALGTSGPSFLWVKVGWGHARRPAGDATFVFADSVMKGGVPLATVGRPVKKGEEWHSEFKAETPMKSADLSYTLDGGLSKDRKWHVAPAKLGKDTVSAVLPEGAKVFFFNVVDDRNLMVSSLSRDLTKQCSN